MAVNTPAMSVTIWLALLRSLAREDKRLASPGHAPFDDGCADGLTSNRSGHSQSPISPDIVCITSRSPPAGRPQPSLLRKSYRVAVYRTYGTLWQISRVAEIQFSLPDQKRRDLKDVAQACRRLIGNRCHEVTIRYGCVTMRIADPAQKVVGEPILHGLLVLGSKPKIRSIAGIEVRIETEHFQPTMPLVQGLIIDQPMAVHHDVPGLQVVREMDQP